MKNKMIFITALMSLFLLAHLLGVSKESVASEKADLLALVDSLGVDTGKSNVIVINNDSTKGQKPDKVSCLSPINVMLIIVIGGAFGGFVDGLKSESEYTVNFGDKKWKIGWMGSVLVGVTASIAIFTIVDAVFNVKLNFELSDSKEFIKLVAWTVLSGYVGPRLLNPLSETFVRKLATDSVRNEMIAVEKVDDDVKISLVKANQALAEYDSKRSYECNGKADSFNKSLEYLLKESLINYTVVLASKPFNVEALMGKSRVYRRMYDIENDTDIKSKNLNMAIGTLDEIIENNPDSAAALYNRACYLVIKNDIEKAKNDLRSAIKIQSILKDYALVDKDFEKLRAVNENWLEQLLKDK